MARFVYASAEADDETDMLLYEDGARLFATREIRLHRHYGAMILAFEGEDMVGVAALAPFPADDSLEFAIAVHPRHERKGVARKLVAAVLAWTKGDLLPSSDGEVIVRGDVVNQNIPPLLQSFGFQDMGRGVWEKTIGAS